MADDLLTQLYIELGVKMKIDYFDEYWGQRRKSVDIREFVNKRLNPPQYEGEIYQLQHNIIQINRYLSRLTAYLIDKGMTAQELKELMELSGKDEVEFNFED